MHKRTIECHKHNAEWKKLDDKKYDYIKQGYHTKCMDRPPVFVIKVLLDCSHTHLIVYCHQLLQCSTAESSSGDKDYLACKPKIFIIWIFKKKWTGSWYKVQKQATLIYNVRSQGSI